MDPFDEKENKNDEQDDDEYESVIIYTVLHLEYRGRNCWRVMQ